MQSTSPPMSPGGGGAHKPPSRAESFRHGSISSPTGSMRLGLRRTSWQLHLPQSVQRFLAALAQVMDGPYVLLAIVLATLISIFLEDIKVMSFPPSADYTFACITLMLWSLFLLELLLNCICKAGYFLSFFFWVDLVSAFSLTQDIPWIWGPMFGLQSDSSESAELKENQQREAEFDVDRIRAFSAAAAKFVRLLKFLRLVRLGRIAKLFDVAQRTLEERARALRRAARDDENTIHAEDYTESSQVGNALSEETTRKVVLLVLVMMLGIPLLQADTEERAERFVVQELNYMASQPVMLGIVTARVESDGVTMTALQPNETAAARARGDTLVTLSSLQLAEMLVGYDPAVGQSYQSGDPYDLPSPQLNASYVLQVVGPANLSVALAALTQARDGMQNQFEWMLASFETTMLYLHIRGAYWSNDFAAPALVLRRVTEMQAAEDPDGPGGKSFGIFSIRDELHLAAMYSIFRTLTVLILLTAGAIAFQHNNKRMVIEPIERMVATIVQLQKNPLAKALLDEHDQEAKGVSNGMGREGGMSGEAQAHAERRHSRRLGAAGTSALCSTWCSWVLHRCCSIERGSAVTRPKKEGAGPNGGHSSTETAMLENTLVKLTGLLQVGFGEAGTRMIQKCMNANPEGDLDPLVDGTRMLAIFGFCDIRRFTDATECLKEEVMVYVNEIADIVHENVCQLEGHPNKNVGDAFLVVWRLKPYHTPLDPDDLFQINEKQPTYIREPLSTLTRRKALQTQAERDAAAEEAKAKMERQRLARAKQASASIPPIIRPLHPLTLVQLSVQADKAVVAFLRVIVDLDASPKLREYEQHPSIVAAFGAGNFAVQLGFGLHCGWAIEGPIGSRYKIDASYLSAHVNLSEALQDLTKEYGTPLLVSGEFYTLLSPYLKSFMRRVDVVRLAGRDQPLNLYAFDIHPEALRCVVARRAPPEYDREAEIEVQELKPSFFNKVRTASTHDEPADEMDDDAAEAHAHDPDLARRNSSVDSPLGSGGLDDMASPLSPGPVRHVVDVLQAHPLFLNPYLNPHALPFDSASLQSFSGATRKAIHASQPIGAHHLVDNWPLHVLQCGIPYAFHDVYAEGLELYLDGRWAQAKEKMNEALLLYPQDQPSQVVLGVMAKHDFVAPPEWAGWHDA